MNRSLVFLFTFFLLALAACGPSAQPAQPSRPQVLVGSGPAAAAAEVPTTTANLRLQSTGTVPAVSPTPGPTLRPRAPKNSAQAIENVAKMVYGAVDARQDLKPYVEGVMTAFGVPPLGNEDVDLATTRLQQGLPLLFTPQVAEMADAFNDGGLITLDSFIAAANARGARQRDTHQPLTREYLSHKFGAYTGKTQYEAGQVMSAFILALSQERAKRMALKEPDPLWGDGLLDPLQVTLLLYSVSYAGSDPRPAPVARTSRAVRLNIIRPPVQDPLPASRIPDAAEGGAVVDFIQDQIGDKATEGVQDMIEIPLDKKEAAQVSVCASLLLYGHKMTVKASPNLLYHNDGIKPAAARVDAVLTFEDDYWDNYLSIDRWMLETFADCKLPRRGPVGGKPIEWSVSDGLLEHGKFDMAPAQTDDNGKALATWRTVPETTPENLRTFQNQRDAVGAIIVRATDLVPGWSTLERIVEFAKDTGNAGDAPLTVIYYQAPHYSVNTAWAGSEITLTGSICAFDKPFTLKLGGQKPGAGPYSGKVEFTPKDSTSGSWMAMGTFTLAFGEPTKDSGGSTYQVTGLADGKPEIVLNEFTQTSITPLPPEVTRVMSAGPLVSTYQWPGMQIPIIQEDGTCSSE